MEETYLKSASPVKSPKENTHSFGLGATNFYEAIKLIAAGAKVKRLEWGNADTYCFLRSEVLHIHTDGADHTWLVSLGDIEGVDWIAL